MKQAVCAAIALVGLVIAVALGGSALASKLRHRPRRKLQRCRPPQKNQLRTSALRKKLTAPYVTDRVRPTDS